MIALSVAKLNFFFARKRNFSLNKEKKNVFVESLDQFRRLEVREKARNVLVMSLRLSDQKVLHNIPSIVIKFFFSFSVGFARFFRSYFVLSKFNKTVIPFALVGDETGYSQPGATRLVGYLPSYIQRALIE